MYEYIKRFYKPHLKTLVSCIYITIKDIWYTRETFNVYKKE